MPQLSRLSIIGYIYEHTPMCVLTEIADAHGIKYDNTHHERPNFAHHLIESIHQTPIPTVGEITTKAEWQYVARFVNKHSQWLQSKLIQTYNFRIDFMSKDDPLPKIPINFTIGSQTPSNINNINACILYKTCVYHRLNITSRTTINQMAYAIKMLRENIESVVRRAKIFVDRDAKRIDLINVLMLSHHEIQDPESDVVESEINYFISPDASVSYDMLHVLHTSLHDTKTLQQRIEPISHEGCIALAAINYGLDISRTREPLRE